MKRDQFYIRHLMHNIQLRKGTKIPLVKRDPYHLALKYQVLRKKNDSKCDFTLDDIFINSHMEKSFEKNEQVLGLINSLRKNKEEEEYFSKIMSRSKSFVTGIRLPKIKLKSRNVLEQSINENSISAKDINHISPIKNNNNDNIHRKHITKGEKQRLFKLNSGVVINCFYGRSRQGENAETLQNMAACANILPPKKNKENINSSNTSKNQPKQKQSFSCLPDIISTSSLLKSKLNKPINKDAFITKMDFISKTLGKISLFGVFHGIGDNGSIISRIVRNYICDYFENAEFETSLKKDNYYTILANAFLSTNTYLKQTISETYDLKESGTTCQLLFFPNDKTHNVYCVNSGNSKTVLYSYSENVPLSYEHYPSRQCEREYILKNGTDVNIITRSVNSGEGINREQSLIVKVNGGSFGGFHLSRVLGCFGWEKAGVTANPEVIEANLNKENGKIIVMGTNGLWKYLTKETVGEIAMRYYEEGNVFGASKDLEETARLKWRKYNKEIEDITVVVIFLKWEKYKAEL